MNPIRVLIVDDSPTMRSVISAVLRRDPNVNIVGEAGDALEARRAIDALKPDVITLDVKMPTMDGLEFLKRIMRHRPTPVVMVSAITTPNAEATIEALENGAVDCVAKPSSDDPNTFLELLAKVQMAARSNLRIWSTPNRRALLSPPNKLPPTNYESDGRVVAIGSSTGGVDALITILSQFPENCPPTLITQHMPAHFTRSFAKRLDRLCSPHVAEAVDVEAISRGRVYLAPGGTTHLEISRASGLRCRVQPGDAVNGHRPSVDVLFDSLAKTVRSNAVGVILTGMGRDGASGLLAMRKAGALTFGQDEESCVVYGMPRVAFEIGAVGQQTPLQSIGRELIAATLSRRDVQASP
jgi:two-component system, chemotaxis family, protein-glutamate methylesterase/glutaminase